MISKHTETKVATGTVVGIVEHGDQRGRTIGFATANLRIGIGHADIGDGVYAATAQLDDGRVFSAAVSIGRRPTFYAEGERLCEVHLLDFDEDIYDRALAVELRWFVRSQQRFGSPDELVAQLRRDVETTRSVLS